MSDILMGWPRTTPLLLPPRRVRAVRQQPTVKGMVFAEFARAVEAGDSHGIRLVDPVTPKTPRRPLTPDSVGGADRK